MTAPRVAVIGAGIAGLGAARALSARVEVTVFEAAARCGGHAHTVDVTLDGVTHGVDTGFLVHNHRTYPLLRRLFADLGVEIAAAEMSFSVQASDGRGGRLEWCGTDLNGVFAQRANLFRPSFLGMLRDLLRFNRLATRLATAGDAGGLEEPLGDFLDRHRFGQAFRDGYLLPMIGCIWSCPTGQMLRFPVATLIRFCHNHGLLQVVNRPTWFTVRGGSRNYVDALVGELRDVRTSMPVVAVEPGRTPGGAVHVVTASGREAFDAVVLACHAPQSLGLLAKGGDGDAARRRVLAAFRTQPNEAVLHTDATLLPERRRAWASWNYERPPTIGGEDGAVCLHYLINRLQPLPWSRPVVVSLNPVRPPRPGQVIQRFAYAHPVFDRAAVEAQAALPALQGEDGVWLCGAWTGYGFHEDGLRSGLEVARELLARRERAARPPSLAWREAA